MSVYKSTYILHIQISIKITIKLPICNSEFPKMLESVQAMCVEWICQVEWLALRTSNLQFFCLRLVCFVPNIFWFNVTPSNRKSRTPLNCRDFWRLVENKQTEKQKPPRSVLEHSCSAPIGVLITLSNEHFTGQISRCLASGHHLLKLSPAKTSQAALGSPQILELHEGLIVSLEI